jgi:hypothetical protein
MQRTPIQKQQLQNAVALLAATRLLSIFLLSRRGVESVVWWDDDEWPEPAEEWGPCEVYVDGPALQALREATGVTEIN